MARATESGAILMGRSERSEYELLDEAVRKALDAFFGWEACELAAQTDPEEIEDAESLWPLTLEAMRELSRVQQSLRGPSD